MGGESGEPVIVAAKLRLSLEQWRELCTLKPRLRAACRTSLLLAHPTLAETQLALIISTPLLTTRLQVLVVLDMVPI